jgi:hypothetical protein
MAAYFAGLDYGLSDVAFQLQTFEDEAKNRVLALEESTHKNLEKSLRSSKGLGPKNYGLKEGEADSQGSGHCALIENRL